MDMYSIKRKSTPQKLLLTVLELGLLIIAARILFGSWGVVISQWFGWASPEILPARRIVIMAFSVIIFLRMVFTMFYLIKRRLPWAEALSIPFAFAIYYVGYAILVLHSSAPLGVIDILAIALFILGCVLNTGSEMQRDIFKRDPQNKGRLYTGGMFAWSMHINFFGDILWVLAYALITQNIWSTVIVIFIFLLFAKFNVPKLDAYLAGRYGDDFVKYAQSTKKLVPWVW
ncbi:MAG: DUF1295 domain-containing protein [Paracoccaceae bacterium]